MGTGVINSSSCSSGPFHLSSLQLPRSRDLTRMLCRTKPFTRSEIDSTGSLSFSREAIPRTSRVLALATIVVVRRRSTLQLTDFKLIPSTRTRIIRQTSKYYHRQLPLYTDPGRPTCRVRRRRRYQNLRASVTFLLPENRNRCFGSGTTDDVIPYRPARTSSIA